MIRVESSKPAQLILLTDDESDTAILGSSLAQVVVPGDVLGLQGTLGAGKTRLSRAIAESLGVDPGAIASPTFVLIHEYEAARFPIFHFDAYRLENPDAFDALGASDYWLEGSGLCLIEWADLVANRLPEETWWIRIAVGAELSGRKFEILQRDNRRLTELRGFLGIAPQDQPGG